jgi:hypothetical protein
VVKSQSHIATDVESMTVGLMARDLLFFDSYGLVFEVRPV